MALEPFINCFTTLQEPCNNCVASNRAEGHTRLVASRCASGSASAGWTPPGLRSEERPQRQPRGRTAWNPGSSRQLAGLQLAAQDDGIAPTTPDRAGYGESIYDPARRLAAGARDIASLLRHSGITRRQRLPELRLATSGSSLTAGIRPRPDDGPGPRVARPERPQRAGGSPSSRGRPVPHGTPSPHRRGWAHAFWAHGLDPRRDRSVLDPPAVLNPPPRRVRANGSTSRDLGCLSPPRRRPEPARGAPHCRVRAPARRGGGSPTLGARSGSAAG